MRGVAKLIAADRRKRQADAFLERLREADETVDLRGLSMEDTFCVLNPTWVRPDHMADLNALLDESLQRPVRGLSSYPPQHGKSESFKAGIARYMVEHPTRRNAYCTYAEDIALDFSRGVRKHAVKAGLAPGEDWRGGYWSVEEGGGLVAVGVGGPLTSRPINGLLILDDPYRDDVEASSEVYRTRIERWLTKVAIPRMHPEASLIINHTRWHPDDVIGRRTVRDEVTGALGPKKGWQYINRPAVEGHTGFDEVEGRFTGEPRALAPKIRPLAFLEGHRREMDAASWASLWEGRPIAEGQALFGLLTLGRLVDAPTAGRTVIGLDLAYTAKKRADYTAAVVLRSGEDRRMHVVHAERWQLPVDQSVGRVSALRRTYPGAPVYWRGSKLEEHGVGPLYRAAGIPLTVLSSTGDKRTNALPFSAGVAKGRVVFCADAPGFELLRSELEVFTGVGDRHDDLVDAAGTAYDALQAGEAPVRSGGRRALSRLGQVR